VRALVALLPFALVPALLATGRVSALASGLAGLLAALAAAALLQEAPPAAVAVALASDVAEGAWLALQAALFIVAGLFFHLAVQAARDGPGQATSPPAARTGFDRRRLFAACFLLGPFLESATGFGVGQVMAVPAILAAGASGVPGVGLSLLTQSLVAWGSLGVGSAVGAALAG
jgi:lactate permease